MSEDDNCIIEKANAEARELKKEYAHAFCDVGKFPPDLTPVSVFMAGSPGAGKTESSQNLIKQLSGEHSVLRIDGDEFRELFPDYNGSNSSLFQAAVTIIAEYIQDCALNNKQSFIFDGTLTNLVKARENIERSLRRGRFVQIVYVYQDPLLAWKFVKEREKKDGRNIPIVDFIQKYFQARENANLLKEEFGDRISVDLIVKNNDNSDLFYKENIDLIDRYVPERYSESKLSQVLQESL
jgi:UDP-N-acetylglucosamine kinase